METVLIAVHLVIVLALAGTVMLQRSEGGGLGMGSSPSGFMSGRGQANLLTRMTAILGAAFFITSLALSIVATRNAAPKSVIGAPAPPQQNAPAPAAPAGAPNVLEQLQNLQQNNTAPKP